MTEPDKAKCFTALLAAARRLDALHNIETSHLTITPMGAKVVMFRTMPDGSLAHVDYLMAWDEIVLTKFDLLDSLISDMHEKLLVAKYEGEQDAS